MKYVYAFAGAMAIGAAAVAGPIGNPADPSLNVPAVTYESPFKSYQPASKDAQSPAATWRSINDDIAIHGGMQMDMDEMDMPMDGKDKVPPPDSAPAAAKQHGHHHPGDSKKHDMPGMSMPMKGGEK